MFFSPITERSLRVRLLYTSLFAALTLGGVTILAPLFIMIAGSMDASAGHRGFRLLPAYLFDDGALWQSFLLGKYNQSAPTLRDAWGDPTADPEKIERPPAPGAGDLKVWDDFVASGAAPEFSWAAGFMGTSRLPQKNRLVFSRWLLAPYDRDIALLNAAMGAQFATPSAIVPPGIGLSGPLLTSSPLMDAYRLFVREVLPLAERIPLNAGGHYRCAFLPRVLGADIRAFNTKYKTNFASYAEVPFTATVPAAGAEEWFLFASKILRPNFVELTDEGAENFAKSGLGRGEFIRLRSLPRDLRLRTLDLAYIEWATARGLHVTEIPQRELDARDFLSRRGEWKRSFLTQNYEVVFDELLVQGRAITNTVILVLLCVAGTLIVNPLAAYALSRYRPRLTYQILLFCLVTVALPAEVTMIPIFLQLKTLGLLNTFGALVLPTLANGFSIFLLKGFFDSLPRELYEAAELDGAGEWTMFWQITMNLSRPILAVLALGAFVSAYGTFMYALILCPDPRMWTIMVYLFQLMQSVDTPILYAALIVSAIPTTLVFVFCQNIILRGIVVPSDK